MTADRGSHATGRIRLGALASVMVVLTIWAYLVSRPAGDEATSVTTERTPVSGRTSGRAAATEDIPLAVEHRLEPRAASVPTNRSLTVRSNLGVPLQKVTATLADGEVVQRVPSHDGDVVFTVGEDCVTIVAPGHLESLVSNGSSIVLDAIASHTVSAPELDGFVRSIGLMPDWPGVDIRQCASWGFISPREWCVAVNPEELAENYPTATLDIGIRSHDGWRVRVSRDTLVAGHTRNQLPAEVVGGAVEAAELRVFATGASVDPSTRFDLLVATLPREGDRRLSQEHAWGRVTILPPAFEASYEIDVAALEAGVSVGEPPVGIDVVVTALSKECGAYGRAVFEHDGALRHVPLHPGGGLRLRIVDESDRPVPAVAARVTLKPLETTSGSIDRLAWRQEIILDDAEWPLIPSRERYRSIPWHPCRPHASSRSLYLSPVSDRSPERSSCGPARSLT